MNRLQKKCAMVTVGIHLLLVVILIVGPGFFAPKPKADDLPLDVIPANLIDAAFNSGVHNATPPPPTAIITPPTPAPTPPAPTPVVTPPPTRKETPGPIRPVVREPTPEPKPADKPKIQINTQLVTRTAPKNSPKTTPRDESQEKARAFPVWAVVAAQRLVAEEVEPVPAEWPPARVAAAAHRGRRC